MRTIGFGGQIANGKTVAAIKLHQLLFINGYNFTKASFALNVKKIFCETFQVESDFIEEWKRKDDPPQGYLKNVRQSLTFIGDGFRQIQPNVWVNLLFRQFEGKNLVIDDIRYLSETTGVKNRGGFNILIWRPGFENNMDNDSEQQLVPFRDKLIQGNKDTPFDYFLVNDGTLDDLCYKIEFELFPKIVEFLN